MAKNLTHLIAEKLGVKTTVEINQQLSQASTVVQTALKNNPNRLAFVIVNLSPNRVYTGPFQNVSSTRGILLQPSGGSLSIHWDLDLDVTGWEWWIMADVAGSNLLIIEHIAR